MEPDGVNGAAGDRDSTDPLSSRPLLDLRPAEATGPVVVGLWRLFLAVARGRRRRLLGRWDPEALHDLRVALRRTRSLLAASAGVVAVPRSARAGVRRLARETGDARDLDVLWGELFDAFVNRRDPSPLAAAVALAKWRAHGEVRRLLIAPQCSELFEEWELLLDPGAAAEAVETPLGDWVPAALVTAARRLVHSNEGAAAARGQALHRFRIRAKRLRYLLECFASLLDPAAVTDWLAELERLQDDLGRLQDLSCQVAILGSLAESRPKAHGDRFWTRVVDERVAEAARLQAVLETPVLTFARQAEERLSLCLAPLQA